MLTVICESPVICTESCTTLENSNTVHVFCCLFEVSTSVILSAADIQNIKQHASLSIILDPENYLT